MHTCENHVFKAIDEKKASNRFMACEYSENRFSICVNGQHTWISLSMIHKVSCECFNECVNEICKI